MNRIVLAVILPLLIIIALEYLITSNLLSYGGVQSFELVSYVVISLIGYVGWYLAFRYSKKKPINRDSIVNFLIGFGFIAMTQKLIFVLLLILALVSLLILSLFGYDSGAPPVILLYRLSLIPLVAMVYGIIWGKYRYKVEKLDLYFEDLPAAFDGMKLVQISDAHSGTWDSLEGVTNGIKLIEEQNPDLIVFTGDLVNADKDEINPFMPLFGRLSAPFGKYAVLGNHDYYGQPRDRALRPAYYDDFFQKYREMGFDLMNNENREIVGADGEVIRLVGVENWGSGRFFPKRGDLDRATENCKPDEFCILLSHDPSHWDLKALNFPKHFHLTLSGHTHGMQFGINLPFFKWSPVQYRYKRWMGLYQEGQQYLYVNRGFGVLGFPGRVGMSPEVTSITLRKAKVWNS